METLKLYDVAFSVSGVSERWLIAADDIADVLKRLESICSGKTLQIRSVVEHVVNDSPQLVRIISRKLEPKVIPSPPIPLPGDLVQPTQPKDPPPVTISAAQPLPADAPTGAPPGYREMSPEAIALANSHFGSNIPTDKV